MGSSSSVLSAARAVIVLQQPVELSLRDVEIAEVVAFDTNDGNRESLVLDSSGRGEDVTFRDPDNIQRSSGERLRPD